MLSIVRALMLTPAVFGQRTNALGESSLKSDPRLSYAIAAILNASAAAAYAAGPAAGNTVASSNEIAEIVVTAQRRDESIQNVPITIQALTAETITQLNVTTFDDFIKYLPNVSAAGAGPGQSNIYMRGLSTGGTGAQGGGATHSFPSVAVYLDEQSGQLPDRNLDIYAADLERIEVLEGPQGTLFGAGAEAGVVRYITNKPKIDVTEGKVNAGYATTAHGDPSTNLDAMINVPIIADKLAVRAVVYNESRGGYINNIPGTFSRAPTDRAIAYYFNGVVPPNSPSINNNALVGKAINPVTYQGLRASALYKINDDWNAVLTQSYQKVDAEGVFWQEEYDGLGKPLPDLSVQLYNPSYDKDKFENTALTINGRINQLKFLYTGGYLNRTSDQVQDYTNYSRGSYAEYYQCNYPGYPFSKDPVTGKRVVTPNSPGQCYSPSTFWTDHENSTHQSHEIRLSTPDDWRVRAIGGLFWEKYAIHEQTDWHYGTSPNFIPIAPPAGATSNNPNVRPLGDAFFDDVTRGYKQKAVFASVDFDLIPKTLTLTAGTRWYSTQNFEVGSNVGSFGCEINGFYDLGVPPNPCGLPASNGNNLDAKNLNKTYSGFKSRANLSWHVTPDALLYFTWSQGFRPGGFNRAQSVIKPTSPIFGLFIPPLAYAPDTLTNKELGWKTEWLDHRLQWNSAVYQEDWNNVQLRIFDPGVTGNLTFTTNGPNYRVRGVETSLVARVTHELTVTGSASWNSSENVKTLSLVNPKTGQPINIVNPFGAIGTPLAQSPPFQGNLRARYEFAINEYQAFLQVGATHQAHSLANTDKLSSTLQGVCQCFDLPAFSTYDASLGISKGDWAVQLYGENLTDTRAILYADYSQYVKENTINRPRTLGLRFSYNFVSK
jgi:outer membrane receptor protein involved in Fe transport